MNLKSNLHYVAFIASFSVWMVSLLIICQPFGLLSTSPPTFPRRIDPSIINIFSISSISSAICSFLIGMDNLGKLASVKEYLKKRFDIE